MKKILLIIGLMFFVGCPEEEGVCIVSGNKLGSMGDPVSIVYKGRSVKFCCPPCIKKFKANPEKYLK